MKMVVVWSFGTELFGDLGFGIRDLDKRSHWLYMVMFLDVAIPINRWACLVKPTSQSPSEGSVVA